MSKVLRKRPKIWNKQLVIQLGFCAFSDTKIHPDAPVPSEASYVFRALVKTRWNWRGNQCMKETHTHTQHVVRFDVLINLNNNKRTWVFINKKSRLTFGSVQINTFHKPGKDDLTWFQLEPEAFFRHNWTKQFWQELESTLSYLVKSPGLWRLPGICSTPHPLRPFCSSFLYSRWNGHLLLHFLIH